MTATYNLKAGHTMAVAVNEGPLMHPTNPAAVKVKREGGNGWHWVYPFDPERHELFDAPAEPVAEEADASPAKPRGRPKKVEG